MKEERNDPIEDLKNIRNMMEKSTKFLSLSGLSGIFAGLTALAGAYVAQRLISDFMNKGQHYFVTGQLSEASNQLTWQLFGLATAVLIIAVGLGFIFTYIKGQASSTKTESPHCFQIVLEHDVTAGLWWFVYPYLI